MRDHIKAVLEGIVDEARYRSNEYEDIDALNQRLVNIEEAAKELLIEMQERRKEQGT